LHLNDADTGATELLKGKLETVVLRWHYATNQVSWGSMPSPIDNLTISVGHQRQNVSTCCCWSLSLMIYSHAFYIISGILQFGYII